MKVRFPEHQLGQGTLGYKGETQAYYDSKRGLWNVARWFIAAAFLILGAAFLVASSASVVPATVVSVTDDSAQGHNVVVLRTSDGVTTTVTMEYSSTPTVGSSTSAMQLPGGRIVAGDYRTEGRITGLLFVAIGLGIGGLAFWRVRHPKPRVTTVLVPDDAYDLGPRRGQSRSAAYDRAEERLP